MVQMRICNEIDEAYLKLLLCQSVWCNRTTETGNKIMKNKAK